MSASALPIPTAVHASGRNAVVIGSVVLLHALALWALNDGLLRAPPDVVVPARILTEFIAPPPPAAVPAPVPAVTAPQHAPPAARPRAAPEPPPRTRSVAQPSVAPQPRPVPDAAPTAPIAPTAPVSQSPAPAQANEAAATSAPAPAAAPVVPAPAPAAPVVVQPSSSAAYLNNPRPDYPAMSKRLGETGRVVVRVLIGPDGRAQEARVQRSSGFERLDQVALETARDRWRYVPGTRGGVPEAMWFNVPINFVLE